MTISGVTRWWIREWPRRGLSLSRFPRHALALARGVWWTTSEPDHVPGAHCLLASPRPARAPVELNARGGLLALLVLAFVLPSGLRPLALHRHRRRDERHRWSAAPPSSPSPCRWPTSRSVTSSPTPCRPPSGDELVTRRIADIEDGVIWTRQRQHRRHRSVDPHPRPVDPGAGRLRRPLCRLCLRRRSPAAPGCSGRPSRRSPSPLPPSDGGGPAARSGRAHRADLRPWVVWQG